MMKIECSTSNQEEFSVSEIRNCAVCDATFEEESLLTEHMMNHKQMKRKTRTRAFNYELNEKKAKMKLLKGAKREKHLDVEIKSTCVNMRFSDGSYHEVVLPFLREWHKQVDKPFKMMDFDIKIVESDAGVDNSEKHMDTKIVVFVNDDRIVLHAYNGTQNLMVQGKNFVNFVVKYLQPYFTKKIEESEGPIAKFNSNVQDMLGKRKSTTNLKSSSSKPFNCPHCRVKASTVGDLRMHLKSSHSSITKKKPARMIKTLNEDTSLLDDSKNSSVIITLD